MGASLGTLLGAALLAVGAGVAVAALRKPEEHVASGHLAGVHMGRHGSHIHGGRRFRSYVPWDAWGGFVDTPQVIILPEASLYGYTYYSGVPSAQGERLVAFSRP